MSLIAIGNGVAIRLGSPLQYTYRWAGLNHKAP